MVWAEQRLVAAALAGQCRTPAAEKEGYRQHRADDRREEGWTLEHRTLEM